MTSLGKRLLLTFTMVPALFSLIWFLPYYNHLAFALLVFITTAYGTYEIRSIAFKPEEKPLIPFWVPTLLPMAEYARILFALSFPTSEAMLFILATLVFAREITYGERDSFMHSMHRITHTAFMMLYPGFFALFLVRLLAHPLAGELLILLFLLVFGNDVFAYVFGMWLGKGNRNVFKASPNKSMAGFIGGMICATLLSLAYTTFVPVMHEAFSWWQSLLTGLTISFTSSVGDLIVSVFKRGSGKKDSGTIMLGRGGLLDSIDSLLVSGPLFLFLVTIFAS